MLEIVNPVKKFSIYLFPLALLILSACGKHTAATSKAEDKTATPPAASADTSQATPVAAPPQKAAAATAKKPGANQPRGIGSGLVGPVHDFMTQQLRLFVQQK